jgi:predicted site-specific integrase-resolvase
MYDGQVTHMNQIEVARRFKLSPRTLERWRQTGEVDLPFIKIGGRVAYRVEDIEAFEARHRHMNTTQIRSSR